MTVAEAVEAPRWRHLQNPTESTYPHTCDDELWLEGRFSPHVRRKLEKRGHELNIIGDWEGTGSEMMIQVDTDQGALHGGADPSTGRVCVGVVAEADGRPQGTLPNRGSVVECGIHPHPPSSRGQALTFPASRGKGDLRGTGDHKGRSYRGT